MQPIHSAASSGQPEVVLLLTQEFGVSPEEKADVCNVINSMIIIRVLLHNLKYHSGRFATCALCCCRWSTGHITVAHRRLWHITKCSDKRNVNMCVHHKFIA